jgi:hypothetical protein
MIVVYYQFFPVNSSPDNSSPIDIQKTQLVLHKSKRSGARRFLADCLTPDVGVVSALVSGDFIEQVGVSTFCWKIVFSENVVKRDVVGDDVLTGISICCGVNGFNGCGAENVVWDVVASDTVDGT